MNGENDLAEIDENEKRTFTLEIKDAEHRAVMRIQQEEIIQEVRILISEIEALRHMTEHQNTVMDRLVASTEIGLLRVSLIPVTVFFCAVSSYFFYIGKLSEPVFVGIFVLLTLPHLGQWVEKGAAMIPILGDLMQPKGKK